MVRPLSQAGNLLAFQGENFARNAASKQIYRPCDTQPVNVFRLTRDFASLLLIVSRRIEMFIQCTLGFMAVLPNVFKLTANR